MVSVELRSKRSRIELLGREKAAKVGAEMNGFIAIIELYHPASLGTEEV